MGTIQTPGGEDSDYVTLNTPVEGLSNKNLSINASSEKLKSEVFTNTKEIKVRDIAAIGFQGLANIFSAPAQLAGALAGVPIGGLLGKIFGGSPSPASNGAAKGNVVMMGLASIVLFPLTVVSLAFSCISQKLEGKELTHEVFANANLVTKKIFQSLISKPQDETELQDFTSPPTSDYTLILIYLKICQTESLEFKDRVIRLRIQAKDNTTQDVTFSKLQTSPTDILHAKNKDDQPIQISVSQIRSVEIIPNQK